MAEERFETWGILEIMGHNRYAGLISEQAVGGASFVRIDVPEFPGRPAFSKLFGAGSIYCLTPTSEEVARGLANNLQQRPLSVYDLPAGLRQRALVQEPVGEEREMDCRDYPH